MATPIARKCNIETISQQDCPTKHDLGRMEVCCPHCNAMMWMEERLSNSPKTKPKFGMCCLSGKVSIPHVPDPPAELAQLLGGDTPESRRFLANIRQYNAGLSMASMTATDPSPRGGVASFTVQGVVYRRIGPLRNAVGEEPACLQTYFYDEAEQVVTLCFCCIL